jgi:uncharacterized protein with PIN domain
MYRFIVDTSIPGLCKFMRMIGIDCAYDRTYSDAYILHVAHLENRIIITRSSKLMTRIKIQDERTRRLEEKIRNSTTDDSIEIQHDIDQQPRYSYYWVNSIGGEEQIAEVTNHFKISFDRDKLFTRCVKCNGEVKPVNKQDIKDQVYESVYNKNDYFAKCDHCNEIYYGDEKGNSFQRKFWENAKSYCGRLCHNETDGSQEIVTG